MLWRPYEASDAPALAELMNVISEHAGGHASYTADELQSLIATLVRDLGSDSSMLVTPDGELAGAGFTTTPPQGGFKAYLTGGVHPRWRGNGYGRRILARHLARAAEIHRELGRGTDWVAEVPRIPAGDQDAARLFARFDLAPVRYWFEMVTPTSQVPATAVPDGLRIADYSPAYEAAVHAAHMEAFADCWGFQRRDLESWLAFTVRSQSFLPRLSLLAFDGNSTVGYLLTYSHADPGRAYVGQLGVLRPWRRRGLASALLASVLGTAARADIKEISLSVDTASATGAVGIYERAGFIIESSSVTHTIPLPW